MHLDYHKRYEQYKDAQEAAQKRLERIDSLCNDVFFVLLAGLSSVAIIVNYL